MTWLAGDCATNGLRLHYLRTGGAKPPIVLLHGLTGSGACWTPVARTLERDSDVVMPDARGHGGSSAPEAGYRYEELAGDVVGLLRELGLARPVLVGHSMGGMTAAVVASRHADLLSRVVLVDPTFLPPERQREVHASSLAALHRRAITRPLAEAITEIRARHPRRDAEIVELQARARLATHVAAFDVLVPPNPDYREVVRAIAVPCLLVLADNGVVTRDMADELCRENPRVEIAVVPDAGHGLPFDQPERVAAVVAAFSASAKN